MRIRVVRGWTHGEAALQLGVRPADVTAAELGAHPVLLRQISTLSDIPDISRPTGRRAVSFCLRVHGDSAPFRLLEQIRGSANGVDDPAPPWLDPHLVLGWLERQGVQVDILPAARLRGRHGCVDLVGGATRLRVTDRCYARSLLNSPAGTRARHVIAHEVGHVVLDHALDCTHGTRTARSRRFEEEADAFAHAFAVAAWPPPETD